MSFSARHLTCRNDEIYTLTISDFPREKKKSSRSRQALKIIFEVSFMVSILLGLLYYIGTTVPITFKPGESVILKGVDYIYTTILTIKVEYLLLAFLMYFGINVLFAVRLRRVLS